MPVYIYLYMLVLPRICGMQMMLQILMAALCMSSASQCGYTSKFYNGHRDLTACGPQIVKALSTHVISKVKQNSGTASGSSPVIKR